MNVNYYNPYVRAELEFYHSNLYGAQELELYHHGVLGQRWGKRNGPPYPLAPSAHSASEKKAGWRNSIYKNGEGTHFSRKVEKYISKKNSVETTSARAAKKSLNLLERQRAKDIYEIRKEQAKGKGLIGQITGSKQDQKKIKQHQANIAAGEAKAKELINKYKKQGYTISSAKVLRDAAYGKHVFANAVLNVPIPGTPLAIAGSAVHAVTRGGKNFVYGQKYRVSEKKNPRYLRKKNYDKTGSTLKNYETVFRMVNNIPGGTRLTNYRRV